MASRQHPQGLLMGYQLGTVSVAQTPGELATLIQRTAAKVEQLKLMGCQPDTVLVVQQLMSELANHLIRMVALAQQLRRVVTYRLGT